MTTAIRRSWALPAGTLDDGEFLLLWIDGETGEGSDHANFTLQSTGGELYLYAGGTTLIDSVIYPAVDADESFGRFPDGDGAWQTMNIPTPDAPNQENTEPTVLYVNEFMADNSSTIEDPDDPGSYEDWIEIYNPGGEAVDMGGMYLTDDLTAPTPWQIPAGVSIAAGGYLVVWADDDMEQGDTHTNFKLGASGEEIGFFDTDGITQVDAIVFGQQYTDVSYGRYPDGVDDWGFMAATPDATNNPHNAPPMISGTAHAPGFPTAADSVWVISTVTDDGSVAAVTLTYDAGGGAVVVTMYDDGVHEDGAAGDDVYGGQIPAFAEVTVVYYYVTATDDLGAASTDPADAPTTRYSYVVGYAPPAIYINEFMADNDTTLEDPDEPGAYEDWIELYNGTAATVDLGGMYLTDALAAPTQWQIPAGVSVPAGGHVLFWADDDTEQGDYHTNFKLGKTGEETGLFDTDAHGNVPVDTLVFGQQYTEVSMGRSPDGADCWRLFAAATPGAANGTAQIGDLDGDNDCDADDLTVFVTVLLDPTVDVGLALLADVNCDGTADGLDVQPFVDAMLSP
jgi:hypothetical protein